MAGSSNFLQWNPNASNQESDAAYLADASRANGAPFNSILGSGLANKLFYQLTVFVAAFAQMMADKGYVLSDANFNNLKVALGNVLTLADKPSSLVSVIFNSTLNFNALLGPSSRVVFQLQLTGSVLSSTLSGLTPGQEVVFILKQTGLGGATFAWPSQLAAIAGTPDTTPNAVSTQSFVVDSTLALYPLSPMSTV